MSWWRRDKLRPEVERQLEVIAFDRLRVFLPIVIFGIVVSLGISMPIGIPLPGPVLFINGAMLMFAVVLYGALRRRLIPGRNVHVVMAIVWLLTPINTLSSYLLTDNATLVLPMMLEVATAAVLVDTRWTLIVSVPVVVFAVPLCFIALMAPHFRTTPTIAAALVAGVAVLALAGLPMRLNLVVAGVLGIVAGTLADFARERWTSR